MRKQGQPAHAQQRFPHVTSPFLRSITLQGAMEMTAQHLIKHNQVALEAAARTDEVSKAEQQRQRNPPPLSAAQLPVQCTRMPSAVSSQRI